MRLEIRDMHQPDDPGQQIVEKHYHTHPNGNGMFGKLVSTLLPLAVVALVGVVWSMSINVARLTEQMSYLTDEVQQLKDRLK